MVHIVVSVAFSLIALGAFAAILWFLMESRGKILHALMLADRAPATKAVRPVRLRTAGRWQASLQPAPRHYAAA